MDSLKIGLMGLNFFSVNLGCGALAYSFRSILEEAAEQTDLNLELTIYTGARTAVWEKSHSDRISERALWYSPRKPSSLRDLGNSAAEQDLIIDFTEGDSFADLYGMKRLCTTVLSKRIAEKRCKYFFLGPQTYGPFKSHLARMLARKCLGDAYTIYSRDKQSADLVEDLIGKQPITTTDVAFALPYERDSMRKEAIGVNVSGLLWNGGYTGNNQFSLRVDYRAYCRKLVEKLLEKHYEVHLIAHVMRDGASPDEDCTACENLHSEFPDCVLAPFFSTPMEAKRYISTLCGFTGARMHATIAAFSSGVPTVPFAYSKKFAGLFGSVGYDYVVDGRELTTDDAVELTTEYLTEEGNIQGDLETSREAALEKLNAFKGDVAGMLVNASKHAI